MKIIYYSDTGNTEKMAELIKKGIEEGGKSADVINISDASVDEVVNEDILIFGCPAKGDEVLEEGEFEPFIEEISDKISGKKVALFGSYGWGDGQWMNDFEERMKGYGCTIIGSPVIVMEEPEDDDEDCINLGKQIASA